MTETQQRFLRAIAERVPVNQVVELHLFPPIRQGGVETGVAVVAEDPRRPVPNAVPADLEPAALSSSTDPSAVAADAEPVDASAHEIVFVVEEPDALAASGDVVADSATPESIDEVGDAASHDVEILAEADDDESPYAEDDDVPGDPEPLDDMPPQSNGHTPAPVSRFTIHTARYRLTLKGVDRGKWEVDVVAEADAPLDAVDAVVRGVQRRAGEGAEPDRLNAEAFRGALDAPLATLER